MDRQDTITEILNRTNVLVEDYTTRFDELVNAMVPRTLSNEEYAARCGALMIALNRELARCAATFGEAHEIEQGTIVLLVGTQFTKNYAMCLDAIRGAAHSTVQ